MWLRSSSWPSLGALSLLASVGCGASGATASTGSAGDREPVALQVLPDRVEGRALLTNDGALAEQAGASGLEVAAADILAEGERLGRFLEIPAGECALVLARASPTVGSVHLFAYDDEGSTFAADESTDAKATLLACPPHPRRLYVVTRVMSGAGLVAIGVQRVTVEVADAVALAVGARGRPGEGSERLESWPGLEAKVRAHRAAIGGRWSDVRRSPVPVGPRSPTRVSFVIEPGRCLDVFVAPSDEIPSLEMVAEDAGGRIVARARETGSDRALVLCSATLTEVSLALRSRGAQGVCALVAGRSGVGAEEEIAASSVAVQVIETRPLSAVREGHERALKGHGFGPARASTGTAKVGSRSSVALDLPAGCARIDVLAGKPLGEFVAELWSEHHELLASRRGGAATTLYACGAGGAGRVDVESLARTGPFAVTVRKDPVAPAALVAHPLAASRLLSRLLAGATGEGEGVSVLGAGTAAGAEVVALDDARLKRVPLSIPADGCVEVIAALDREGAGLDLRLVDAGTGEGQVARGRYVISDRRCAGSVASTGVAELRLAAGKGDALVLVRAVPGP
ncbi:hypothetical protein [Chondromyces crocatus]|uniref:Secreted protein n=1 Tax=Chondromyces crocatus TaxID=52 RepID=A0A0K1EF17_CHOCO|nr:hypothetical protein [Chondromyces crocatus]AKT39158.1 uncharacterized protein CMC5_033050 [Chondromyces crocatus]